MKRFWVIIMLLAIVTSILSGCKNKSNQADTNPSAASKVTTTPTPSADGFTDLGTDEITNVMSPGWNLGNQLEAIKDGTPGETNWGNPIITEDLIKAVKKAGFKSIRIPVSYFSMIGEGPDYTIDEAWLNRVQEVVDYVVHNGLYAVINIYGDGFQSIDGGWLYVDAKDQDTIKAKFQAVWQQLATRFKDYDEHLIFETMNEISDMSYGDPKPELYKVINSYNQIALDTIRQAGGYNDMRWVLMPGWNTDIEQTATEGIGFVIPTEDYLSDQIEASSRIMISVHYYSPWDFCGVTNGEITQWGENATNGNKSSTHSGQSYMAAQFKLLYDSFISKGYPVVIGEYGAIDKTVADPDNAYFREYFNRKLNENSFKYGCISMYWDNGYNSDYGFGLFDRATATVTQQGIINAIMAAYHPVAEAVGNSTGITLDQSEVTMDTGDDPLTLKAALTPADSTDTVKWSSSDETIVTVSNHGRIRPQAPGTAIISALTNGNTAKCTVTVSASPNCHVRLYAFETSTWNTIQSESAAEITKDGGTFTLTMTGSKDLLSNIGALFIKDISVQNAIADTSIFASAKIKLDSVKFNGVLLKTTMKQGEEAINSASMAFDYSILNQWDEGKEKIKGALLNKTGSYRFSGVNYLDTNKIEVTFTVTDVIKK